MTSASSWPAAAIRLPRKRSSSPASAGSSRSSTDATAFGRARSWPPACCRTKRFSVLWNSVIEEVLGDTHVTGLRIKNVLDGKVEDVEADALFVAIGHTPNTAVFVGQLDLDERAYVASPDGTTTNVEGVFVAGDVNDFRYRQAVTAAGAGCRAAMDAEKYLEALEFKVDSLARL